MKNSKILLVLIISFCFVGFAAGSLNAQPAQVILEQAQRVEIDRVFAHFNNDTPGAALAVAKNGEIIYKQGYGMSNLEYDIPITPSSTFHVASVSKEFTAMCIVLLARQGKLSIDDDIRKHIPEVPDFGETITIRHLLHHISGLRDQWNLFSMSGWRASDVKMQSDVLNFVKHQKELNFKPGEEYVYCNTGYTLLAETVERVSGKSLREFADEHIFRLLGMKNTHVHDNHLEIVKNRTYAYVPQRDGGYRISIPIFDTYGATSLFTTVEDLALWADNFVHKRVGGEEGINMLLTRGKLNNDEELTYAFGITHGTYKGLKTIGHSGSDAGYRAQFTMYPEHGIAIIVLSNVSNGNPGSLARQVADIVLADYIVEPEQQARQQPQRERRQTPEPPALTEDQLKEYAGTYYSEELDVFYAIVREDTSLVLQRKKFSDSTLRVREIDSFSSGSYRINFIRNEENKITGFTITTGRVRNLRFDKK